MSSTQDPEEVVIYGQDIEVPNQSNTLAVTRVMSPNDVFSRGAMSETHYACVACPGCGQAAQEAGASPAA